jgi:hypothetical protein
MNNFIYIKTNQTNLIVTLFGDWYLIPFIWTYEVECDLGYRYFYLVELWILFIFILLFLVL